MSWISCLSPFCVIMCTSSALEWKGNVFLTWVSNKCHWMAVLEMYHYEAEYKLQLQTLKKKIKATKPSIIVKARIKFSHSLKSVATSLLGSIIHKLRWLEPGSPWGLWLTRLDSKAENLNEHSTTARWTPQWSGAQLQQCHQQCQWEMQIIPFRLLQPLHGLH